MTGPPHGGDESDNEDVDEDLTLDVDGMPREVAADLETMAYESEDDTPILNPPKRKKTANKIQWKNENGSFKFTTKPANEDKLDAKKIFSQRHPNKIGASEYEVFSVIFEKIIPHLVTETNRYAQQRNIHDFHVTRKEMEQFIGLLFLSSYNSRQNMRDYWSKNDLLECKPFVECMGRNRFIYIKSMLHCCNNESLGANKMAKVTPLYDIVNESLQLFGILHDNLSIDKSIVPYFGRHSCKQFIRGKPIRFGYKLWVLCSFTGMPCRVSLYEGKSLNQTNEPLGSRVVKQLISNCKSGNHHLFLIIFFPLLI